MFGYIQSKLFPKYFLLGTILSSLTTLSYLVEHPFSSWGFKEKIQVCPTLLVTMETHTQKKLKASTYTR